MGRRREANKRIGLRSISYKKHFQDIKNFGVPPRFQGR